MSTYEDIRNILNRIDGINAPVQEDPGLTDIQKQGLKTVYEKYKNRKGYNGDVLPIGYLDCLLYTSPSPRD